LVYEYKTGPYKENFNDKVYIWVRKKP
jgi:hypothetical protein